MKNINTSKKYLKSTGFFIGWLSISLFISGCSQYPSESDIRTALNDALQKSCSIASVSNVVKENGMEQVKDGNRYYSVQIKYDLLMKYDSEWMQKNNQHVKDMRASDVEYAKAYSETTALVDGELKKHVDEMNLLVKNSIDNEKRITEFSSKYRDTRNLSQNEQEAVNLEFKDLNARKIDIIKETMSLSSNYKNGLANKFSKITEDYAKKINSNRANDSVRIKYADEITDHVTNFYDIPIKISNRDIDPVMSEGCIFFNSRGISSDILFAAKDARRKAGILELKSEHLIEGQVAHLSTKALMRKSERGWIFSE